MDLPDAVQVTIKNGADIFSKIVKYGNYQYSYITLKCSELPTPIWKKGHPIPSKLNTEFFTKLPSKEFPALYYFKITSNHLNTEIVDTFKYFKDHSKIKRASSALKKYPPTKTTVLYVGKVKKDILGRMKVHLGYYHNNNTSGLQLACWAPTINLKLKLHIFIFDKDMEPFISSLELPFSRSLSPMIGKQ